MVLFLTLSLILILSVNPVSAATDNHSYTTAASDTTNPTSAETSQVYIPDPKLASGSTSTISVSTFTQSQINDASSRIKTFVETNKRLPNYVTINNVQVTMPQFLNLVVKDLLLINTGSTSSITLNSVDYPSTPSQSFVSGSIYKTEYLNIATKINAYITSNGKAPNYGSTSLGTIRYEPLIYMYSKILNYYKINSRLPGYVSVNPGAVQTSSNTTNIIPTNLQIYLQPGTNAQSTNPTIIALANSITEGKTSNYSKAVALFNWVRDHIPYSFYYGTKYGAVGTLSKGTGNCVDHSHLLAALSRAVGIPARYQYGSCTFADGRFAHVWNQIYVDGKWYFADTISANNTFGRINNWNLKTYTLYGTYAQW